MAQKVTVVLKDDLDGGPAEQTVRFAYEGPEYEIGDADGCSSNAGRPGDHAWLSWRPTPLTAAPP